MKIMMVRTVPDGDERDKDIANAIRYAVDNGANVINMSFGKGFSPEKAAVDEAVKYADSKGVLMVHAAGNDGENLAEKSFPTPVYLTAASLKLDRGGCVVVEGPRQPGGAVLELRQGAGGRVRAGRGHPVDGAGRRVRARERHEHGGPGGLGPRGDADVLLPEPLGRGREANHHDVDALCGPEGARPGAERERFRLARFRLLAASSTRTRRSSWRKKSALEKRVRSRLTKGEEFTPYRSGRSRRLPTGCALLLRPAHGAMMAAVQV